MAAVDQITLESRWEVEEHKMNSYLTELPWFMFIPFSSNYVWTTPQSVLATLAGYHFKNACRCLTPLLLAWKIAKLRGTIFNSRNDLKVGTVLYWNLVLRTNISLCYANSTGPCNEESPSLLSRMGYIELLELQLASRLNWVSHFRTHHPSVRTGDERKVSWLSSFFGKFSNRRHAAEIGIAGFQTMLSNPFHESPPWWQHRDTQMLEGERFQPPVCHHLLKMECETWVTFLSFFLCSQYIHELLPCSSPQSILR